MSNFSELFDVLLKNSETIPEMDFRILLEKIYYLNPAAVAPEIQALLYSESINLKIRMNLIRICGYIQDELFLLPLKKIIDYEKNIHIKKEALIAISKYNNRKAFNILTQISSQLQDPLLLNLVKNEIAKIKKNNPLLAMLPNFLIGDPQNKLFKISIQILKKILNPDNALEFSAYLNVENEAIRNGAFEILCSCADNRLSGNIKDYFMENFKQKESQPSETAKQSFLLENLLSFLQRYPELISDYYPFLAEAYQKTEDSSLHLLIVSILSRSEDEAILKFLSSLIDRKELLEEIVAAIASSDKGTAFLIKEKADVLPPQILFVSLLKTETGVSYLLDRYSRLSLEEKLLIIRNQTVLSYNKFKPLLAQELVCENFQLQSAVLECVTKFNDRSLFNILIDETNQPLFLKNHELWLQSLKKLAPLQSFLFLIKKISADRDLLRRAKTILPAYDEIFFFQPVFNQFADQESFLNFSRSLLALNQKEFSLLLLNFLKSCKTFSKDVYNLLVNTLKDYNTYKEGNLSAEELNEIKKIRFNLLENLKIIQQIQEAEKLWNLHLNDKETSNSTFLERILKNYPLFLFFNREKIVSGLLSEFAKKTLAFQEAILSLIEKNVYYATYFLQLTDLGFRKSLKIETSVRNIRQQRLEQLKIRILLEDEFLINILYDQLRMIFHDFEIDFSYPESKNDILLTNSTIFKNLLLEKKIIPEHSIVALEQIEDFSLLKQYNPVCIQNWDLFKTIRHIISRIFSVGEN